MALLPGWLSATLVAVLTGFVMLLAFKYTSQQQAIQRVRNAIKANLLALSLFKESTAVMLRCQGGLLGAAASVAAFGRAGAGDDAADVLLFAQLALWYEARPLAVGEAALLTVSFSDTTAELPATARRADRRRRH